MEDKEAKSAQCDRVSSLPASDTPEAVLKKRPLISMLLVPIFVIAGAAIIFYLSFLSSKTLSLVGDLHQLQENAEQLRHQVVVHSIEPPSADLTAEVRRSLLELKGRDIREPYKQQIEAAILYGGEFVEQAEQVRFTNSRFEEVAYRLSDLLHQDSMSTRLRAIYYQLSAYVLAALHPASSYSGQADLELLSKQQSDLELQISPLDEEEKQQVQEIMALLEPALSRYMQYRPVIESVIENRFTDELRLIQSELLRFDHELNRLLGWFAVLWAVMGLGLAGIGYSGNRTKPGLMKSSAEQAVTRASESYETEQAQDTEPSLADGLLPEKNVPYAPLPGAPESEGGMNTEPAERVLDIQYMVDNMDGDQQAVAMLLEVFLEEHSADAKRLSACLQAGKVHEAGLIAHSLKSVAGSFGAKQLRRITEQIEQYCKQGGGVEPSEISRLSEAIESLRLAIVEYLQSGLPVSEIASPQPALYKVERKEESLAVLNIAYMLSTMDDDAESVSILLQVFIDEHAQDANELWRMVHGCTPETISEAAFRRIHSLKGVAGSIGAEVLRRQVESVESCYKRKQVVADEQYRELSDTLDETVEAAKRYLLDHAAVIG